MQNSISWLCPQAYLVFMCLKSKFELATRILEICMHKKENAQAPILQPLYGHKRNNGMQFFSVLMYRFRCMFIDNKTGNTEWTLAELYIVQKRIKYKVPFLSTFD